MLLRLAHAAGVSCQVQGLKVPLEVQAHASSMPVQARVSVGSIWQVKVQGFSIGQVHTRQDILAHACDVMDNAARLYLGAVTPFGAQADARLYCRTTYVCLRGLIFL